MSYIKRKYEVIYRQRGNPRAPLHWLAFETTSREAAMIIAQRHWLQEGLDGQYVILKVNRCSEEDK